MPEENGNRDLLDQPAHVIAAAVRTGATTAREVAEMAIARVLARNAALNAIVDFDPAEARREADRVDARRHDDFAGPLLGVPFTVKDKIWVAGRRVTNGSLLSKDFIPPRDALAVERLRAAGGVFLGMTNTPEFASKGHTDNKVYGLTRHPQNPALTPGGSSGGAAAALGAGFAPVALGTDGGGSGRRPAAHVGAVGLKPSAGAIPAPFGFEGFFSPTIEVLSPMGRCVADVRLMFEAMAGPDARDPVSAAVLDSHPPVRPRIAYSPRLGLGVAVDPDVRDAVDGAVERLRTAGWVIDAADVAWPQGVHAQAFDAITLSAAAQLHGERWQSDSSVFSDNIQAQIKAGLNVTGADVSAATLLADRVARAVAAFFVDHDYLLTPTTACVAWPVEQDFPPVIEGEPAGPRGHAAFTPLFNQALVPAISLHCGTGRDGLPVGLQIVAPRGHDRALLEMAARAERVLA
ncbi:MAG TPA: amidase [Vineibacter sp.]|nr:amidase [Vineibacter sp.]